MSFGLSSAGLSIKRLSDIKSEIEATFRSILGNSINLTDSSNFGQLVGIFSDREASLWELVEDVYNSQYPDTAEGASLDGAVAFNGITRLGAAKSVQQNQLLFGTVGSLIAAGTQFSVTGNPNAKFQTNADVTLVTGLDAIQKLTFSAVPDAGSFTITYLGQTTSAIAYNAIASAVASALNSLPGLTGAIVTGNFSIGFTIEFGGNNGLQAQALLIVASILTLTSNPVTISVTQTQAGIPQGIVDCTATVTGPINAPIGTLTVIDTPVSGLSRTINTQITDLGRNLETDIELRIRRINTLSVAGKATVDAIRANLLNISGVINVDIFENATLVTDGGGRPGKSFEAVLQGGIDQDIANAIWASKPAGIQTDGSTSVNVLDSLGQTRVVNFSRPTQVRIYTSLDITKDPLLFPTNGAALVQQAIMTWGNALGIGTDIVVYPQLVAQLNSIVGILDVTVRIGRSPVSTTPGAPAADNNIIIAAFEVASFAAGDTGVNVL